MPERRRASHPATLQNGRGRPVRQQRRVAALLVEARRTPRLRRSRLAGRHQTLVHIDRGTVSKVPVDVAQPGCPRLFIPDLAIDPAIDLDLGGWMPLAGTLVSCRMMGLDWEQAVIDAQDPVALGRWWLEALRWVLVNDEPDEFEIRPCADQIPGLIFAPVAEAKRTKNRLHLDFRPDDQGAEVERLVGLGRASRRCGSGRGVLGGSG